MPARRRRWQLPLLGANLLFYAMPARVRTAGAAGQQRFLVWWCGRRTAKKPVFLGGLAAAQLPLALWSICRCAGLVGHAGERSGHRLFYAQLVSYLCDVRRGRIFFA